MTQDMSQSSQNASGRTAARTPRLRRGRERVSALLAAAAVFVERGYDGATMTEIAAQAGASIGSLYQFFPTKTLIAEALHGQELEALLGVIGGLSAAAPPGGSLADVAGLLFDRLVAFLADHPAFLAMAERRDIDPVRKAETRRTMLEQIGALLATASPAPGAARQEAVSILLLTLLKAAVSLQAAQGETPAARKLVAELRTMAVKHLAEN